MVESFVSSLIDELQYILARKNVILMFTIYFCSQGKKDYIYIYTHIVSKINKGTINGRDDNTEINVWLWLRLRLWLRLSWPDAEVRTGTSTHAMKKGGVRLYEAESI